MENGLYMIIDYYPKVENQPMICVIQVDEAQVSAEASIQLPAYLDVDREITDLPEFQPTALAKKTVLSRIDEEKK